jgi:hypothetical protein
MGWLPTIKPARWGEPATPKILFLFLFFEKISFFNIFLKNKKIIIIGHMVQCDWCWRSILFSFERNFNGYTIFVFMKTIGTSYDTNQTLKEKNNSNNNNKVSKPYKVFKYLTL